MHDQIQAACAEVQTYVANLQLHPPQGAHFAHMDGTIERAVMNRMSRDMATGELFTCCHRVNFPRMLYYVPRHRALFCQEHWDQVRMCECFEECDACEMPISSAKMVYMADQRLDDVRADEHVDHLSSAKMVYMFVGPYIIQALICHSCGDHLRLSPTGG